MPIHPYVGGKRNIVMIQLQKVRTGEVLFRTNLGTGKANGGRWMAAQSFAREFEIAVRSGRAQKSAPVVAAAVE